MKKLIVPILLFITGASMMATTYPKSRAKSDSMIFSSSHVDSLSYRTVIERKRSNARTCSVFR